MWKINWIKNSYKGAVSIDAGYVIGRGQVFDGVAPPPRGNLSIAIPKRGTIDFVDIGDRPLGPASPTRGVHITHGNKAWVYRYEGDGGIGITIEENGSVALIGERWEVIPLPLAEWAGTYQASACKYTPGSEDRTTIEGPWESRPPLVITNTGDVLYNGKSVGPVEFDASTRRLTWRTGMSEGDVTLHRRGLEDRSHVFYWGEGSTIKGAHLDGHVTEWPGPNKWHYRGLLGLTPEQAIKALLDGNERYRNGTSLHPNQTDERRAEQATSQTPFAIVFGCVDSRAIPEVLFDQGIGDLFVVRTAGPVLDDAALGSIEYAVEKLKVQLIVVLGHEHCGAVAATVDAVKNPGTSYPGSIDKLVARIKPAVEEVINQTGDTVDLANRAHVKRTIAALQRSPVIESAEKAGKLRIVGARYDLDDGKVDILR